MELPGAFSGCACAIAKPSAKMSAQPNAKLANLRTMARSYTSPTARAIRSAGLPFTVSAFISGMCFVTEWAVTIDEADPDRQLVRGRSLFHVIHDDRLHESLSWLQLETEVLHRL